MGLPSHDLAKDGWWFTGLGKDLDWRSEDEAADAAVPGTPFHDMPDAEHAHKGPQNSY